MPYSRPDIVENETRANRAFWENVLDGVDEGIAGGGGAAAALVASPSEQVARLADFGVGFQRGAIAGDSTWNDGNDPMRKVLLRLAQITDADVGLTERFWSAGTYGAPVAVRAFTSTPALGGTVLTDNFNRTASELVGSTTSGGQTWAGGAGAYSADGSAASGSSGTLALGFNCTTKAMTAVGNLKVVTATPASAQQVRVVVGATQANFSGGGSYVWAQVLVNTSGVPQVSVWKRVGGASTQIGATATVAGLATNSGSPQDLQVKVEIAIQAVTVTLTVAGNDQVIDSTVSESDTAVLGSYAGFAFPANTLGAFKMDAFSLAVPSTPGTQGSGIEVWNAATAGTTLANQVSNMATMYPSDTDFDWLLVSTGHNYGTQDVDTFIAGVDAFVDAFVAQHPETQIVISSQNPQFAPRSQAEIDAHARRQAALRGYALRGGFEYLPVFEAFTAQSDGGASLVNPADGVHPTVSTTSNISTWCGNLLWAAVWVAAIQSRRAAVERLSALP